MAFGLGRLRWPPDAFWDATPHEIAAALQAHQVPVATAPDRLALDQMMQAHPDR